MNNPIGFCISAILAQALLVGHLEADDSIFISGFESCYPGNKLVWDGGGDGVSWADPANWKGDVLPADGDSISIQVFSQQAVIYDNSLDVTSVRCLDTERALVVTGGDLEVTEAGNVSPGIVITGGTFRVTGGLRVTSG